APSVMRPWARQPSSGPRTDPGQRSLRARARAREAWPVFDEPWISGGPTPVGTPRIGELYPWKVQHGRPQKHVDAQIADAVRPEAFDEPLRSGIESKGGSVLTRLLERGEVPIRIKITSAGITQIGVDRRTRPLIV